MGYQESFVTTTNKKHFDALVERVKNIGKEYYTGFNCLPSFIITVKQNIHGLYDNKIKLKKNKKYIYFTGERHLLRSPSNLLNLNNTDTMPFNMEKIDSEEIDGSKIFDTSKNPDGEIYPGLNNEYLEVITFNF